MVQLPASPVSFPLLASKNVPLCKIWQTIRKLVQKIANVFLRWPFFRHLAFCLESFIQPSSLLLSALGCWFNSPPPSSCCGTPSFYCQANVTCKFSRYIHTAGKLPHQAVWCIVTIRVQGGNVGFYFYIDIVLLAWNLVTVNIIRTSLHCGQGVQWIELCISWLQDDSDCQSF